MRYNLYITTFTNFKCVIGCLANAYSRVNITTIKIENIFITLKHFFLPFNPCLMVLCLVVLSLPLSYGKTNLLSITKFLHFLEFNIYGIKYFVDFYV